MSYSNLSHIIVAFIAICLWRWIEKMNEPANGGWHLYPDNLPRARSWYLVTMIEKLFPESDEYVTYTTTMYYLGDKRWINRTVQYISAEYDFIKTTGEIGTYNEDVLKLYSVNDDEPNKLGRRIVAWKEMNDIYIKPGVNYYGTNNRCDIYPDAIKR